MRHGPFMVPLCSPPRRSWLLWLAALGVAGTLTSCSDPASCVPGTTQACLCAPSVPGVQRCADDGAHFETCECEGHDAGPADDASVLDAGFDAHDASLADVSPGVDSGSPARCRDLGPVRGMPGAVGFGALTEGGRGGAILVVDNLEDSGPGSLRAALEQTGPRFIVFRVGGTILLRDTLRISDGRVTIAGESAPGGGIALRTHESVTSPAMITSADDVVIRHLRFRPGASTELSNSVDAITVVAGQRILLANNSFSWSTDENVNLWYDASDITMQDCISSEGLFMSTHTYEAPHSKGFISGPDNERISLVRNVFAFNDDRNPLVQSDTSYEIVNNVVYDGYQVGTQMALRPNSRANLIGNVYLPGPDYRPSRYQIIAYAADDLPLPDGAIFALDNLSPRSRPDDPWAAMGWGGIHGGDYNGSPLPRSVRADAVFPMSEAAVTAQPADGLVERLLPTVGASLPRRDAVDARVLDALQAGGGGLIDDPSEVGGWPELAAGSPPEDADADGMPDAWERARGLDPSDADDAWADRDGDGWPNLEEYLACID